MASTVQIEVRVDDTGVTTGLNKVQGSFKQLSDAVKQAMRNLSEAQAQLGAAAEAGSVQAKKVLQEYEGAVQRAQTALTEYSATAEAAAASTSALTGAVEHQIPQMAAASAAVRYFEGNTQGSIRAAERFLSTTLNLGPALQAAFPVFGALAFLGVIEHVADKVSKFFADVLIYTDSAKRSYQEQVAANNLLAAAVAHLGQAEAELFTTTHSAHENIQRDLTMEAQQRDALTKKIDDQQKVVNDLTAATKSYYAFLNSDQFNKFGGSSAGSFDAAKQAAGAAQARLQALKDEAQAIDDTIQTSEAKLTDVQEKAADDARKRAEQNAEAYYQAWKHATDKTAELMKQQDSLQREQDKLFNTFENDQFKQTTEENKVELDRRSRDTEKAVKDNQRMVVQQAREFQQYTHQLGNDLYQMFNEITSGNIGKLIKEGFTRLFANILAQWIATVQGIGNVSRGSTRGGASGLLGSLLGSILGIGGGGGATAGAGTGPYGLPAGVASNFGEFDNLSSFPAGPGIALGGGSLSTASIGGDIGGSILGSVLNSPVGGVSSGVPQKQGGPLAGLLSAATLQKLGPLAVLSSLMLASKGGVSAAVGGALIAALGLGALYGPSTALTAAAAPFAGFLGPLAGGLIGFGVGSATGSPTLGGLSGAGSGALIGLAAAGPIGALIGGIIGGLAGLFGGLFGGGPSKHTQADRYINANILPAIQQELTNFEGFSTDYATAINDLDQLKSQSYTQMKQQFGTDATNDEWSKYVVPAVQKAEDRINADQAERNRRGTLVFGAPQFAEGGIFGGGSMPGGAGWAILHPGEQTMTALATRMYGPQLAAMEASAKAGTPMRTSGSPIVINIQALDAKSFHSYLKSGGGDVLASYVQGRRQEGRGF